MIAASIAMKTIFIVDDDEMQSMMLEDYLGQNPHYIIYTFPTGEACLAMLHLKPDVVILDFNLDNVDANAANGLEILKQIKQIDKHTYVIMYSSQLQFGKARSTIGSEALDYVMKDTKAFEKVSKLISII